MPSEMLSAAGFPAGALSGDDRPAFATPGDDPVAQGAYLNADSRAGTADNGKLSYTIDQAANQLVRGEPGWSSALGVPYTVTYAYRAAEPTQMPDDTAGFSRFNTAQIAQAELAIQGWQDVANIHFVRIGAGVIGDGAYSDNAAILFGNYASGSDGSSAFANFPGNPSPSSQAGDVWINSTFGYNTAPNVGNYGGQVLIHELGHAIGLAHPSEYNAEEGLTITYSADADYFEDSRQYTVMSYFNEFATGGNFGPLYSAAPLLDDIAAAQLEYGANMSTRTGDTVYGFNANADRPWFITGSASTKLLFAVWDAGGNDTFDFSGYAQNQLIDIREGFFSNVGGLVGNVAVAQHAGIENVKSGSGADLINGNPLNNNIQAGAGADTIDGGQGQSFLRGDEGNDSITGGSSFDDANGNMGNDTVSTGAGDDYSVGGKDNDLLFGDAGGDVVWGNLGNDTCNGGDGNDQVRGGQDNDIVDGGAGDDYVSGDKGSDTVTGGTGADLFHTWGEAGLDRVLDFHVAEGDRVLLDPGTTYTVGQVGADTVIDMVGGAQMILVGVSMSSLLAGSILFA